MQTLNKIAYEVAHGFKKPKDTIFRNRLKQMAVDARATLAERRFRKGMAIESDYLQDLGAVPLIKVDRAESVCKGISLDCVVLRTKDKIPQTIPTLIDSPFMYVGGLDKSTPYSYVPQHLVSTIGHSKFTSRKPRYSFSNGYVYIYTFGKWAKGLKFVNIIAPFADPREVEKFNKCEGAECYTDDDRFPIPQDLARNIIEYMYQQLAPGFQGDDLEVPVSAKSQQVRTTK